MPVVYRAVWNDDRPNLCADAAAAFHRWHRERRGGAGESDEEVRVGRTRSGSIEAVRLSVTDERTAHTTADDPVDGAVDARVDAPRDVDDETDAEVRSRRTVTTLTAIDGPDGGIVWVDVETTDAAPSPTDLAAPGFVGDLVASGRDPRVDHVRLSPRPGTIRAKALAGVVGREGRSLPLVVFTHDPGFDQSMTIDRAAITQHRLVGAAQVYVLAPDDLAPDDVAAGGTASTALTGPDDEPFGPGEVRVFLPNAGDGPHGGRGYRQIAPAHLGLEPARAADLIATLLQGTIPARRQPSAYQAVRAELRDTTTDGATDLLALAERDVAALQLDLDDLKGVVARLQDDLLDTQADLDEAVREAAELRRQLVWRQHVPSASPTEEPTFPLADSPTTIRDALDWAGRHLDGIAIHPDAPRAIRDFDPVPHHEAWAELIWRGLRALHVYASADHDGDFWDWCLTSGHVWAWPASPKKLSMTESSTVMTRDRFARQRLLPVATDVDPSGRIHMWAHLKIAEGGGPLAPRVYFHDDVDGTTGLVHVGFVGPHRFMHNTRTN